MASLNRVQLIGRLTRDPQVKYSAGGTAIADVGLAVNRRWFDKQSNQWKESCDFIDVTLFGQQASFAGEHLARGREVFVEGRLQLDTWEDRETKKKRSKLNVIGDSIQPLGSKPGHSPDTRSEPVQERNQAPVTEPESAFAGDDVPF